MIQLRRGSPILITIAAVIPLYNGAPFIREALESVLAQSEPADEIIVVDDGSTDEGPAIVADMARRHPITLLSQPNAGQSAARNHAIRHTGCSHIALLDQDDIWYDDHLAILKQAFSDGKVRRLGFVHGNLDQIDRAGRMMVHGVLDMLPIAHPLHSATECLKHDLFILPGASLIAKAAIVAAGYFDERLSGYEDDDLFLRLFLLGYRSIYINEAVTQWRIYPSSTSFSPRMARSRMIYFHKLIEAFPDEPRLNLYFGRDVIGPRFMRLLRSEFIEGSRQRDKARTAQAWADINTIMPAMRPRTRRRFAVLRPLIEVLYDGPFTDLARFLLRQAVR